MPSTVRNATVAYLVNQYPSISHSFIRREILALERQGLTVHRFSIRGWDAPLVDTGDMAEREKTRYVLSGGIMGLIADAAITALRRPMRFLAALRAAFAMSRKAQRPLPYHLVYLASACRLRRWLDRDPAVHFHAHFGTNPAEIAHLVHCLGGPEYSFTIHGQDEIEGAKQLHFPTKIGAAKFVAAISAYCRSQILREIPLELWPKLRIIHCGLDASYFLDKTPDFPPTPVFLCVGRLSPEKGHLILLEAFAAVLDRHPEAKLVLAGDGPMRGLVQERISELNLSQAIRITGWIDAAAVQAELDAATALVQPSFIEGLPVVIMEAMARRRPVISTYVGGIPELVIPKETGWLVPSGEVSALAEAMEAVAATNPTMLRSLGDAGYLRARDRHLIDSEAEKLVSHFLGDKP